MDNRHQYHYPYLKPEQREKIRNVTLLFVGIDADSTSIAECALRFGFEKIKLVDDAKVNEEDLSCLNLPKTDIGDFKVDAIKRRLKAIVPAAKITSAASPIQSNELNDISQQPLIIVRTLNFLTPEISEYFDRYCRKHQVLTLYFCNLGWAGLIVVTDPLRRQLTEPTKDNGTPKSALIKHVADFYRYWGSPLQWLEDILITSFDEKTPQLPVGTWILGGLATSVLCDIAIGNDIRYYPQFYMLTVKS